MVADTQSLSALHGDHERADSQADARGGPAAIRRFGRIEMLAIAIASAALGYIFWRPIGWLWQTWMNRPEYSHGPIMPLIAAFLVWQRKDELQRLEFSGDWRALILVAFAGFLYALGVLGSVYTVQQYALIVALCGLTLALTGPRAFAKLLAPLAVLVLMIPPPDFILNNLSAKLQLLSSSLGVSFIRLLGISVFLEGNVIDLGGYRLQVIEACDGMRYLFPLMTIGLLIAYFYKGATWKRVCIFVLSVPITVLMNSLRVGTIGVLVEHWGGQMAEGFLHEFQGWMVFMLSTGLLLGAAAVLNGVGRETAPWRQRFGLELPASAPRATAHSRRTLPPSYYAAAGLVLAGAVAATLVPAIREVVPARLPFATFPTRIADWAGRRDTLGPDFLSVLQLDDYILADFSNRAGERVNFYVSYYDSQRDRRVVHSPRACIPGGGWHIDSSGLQTLAGNGQRMNRLIIVNGEQRQLVYYWFDQRGRSLTSEFAVKWYLFWDAVTRHRSDGAMVRLITAIGATEPVASADARLESFATEIVERLPAYIPH